MEFIERMDNFFDMMNSNNLNHPKEHASAYRSEPKQKQFLIDSCKMIKDLVVVNREGVSMTNKVKCFWGLQISIKSVLLLFEDLKSEGFEYLYTRRLNQEFSNNLFAQIICPRPNLLFY